MPVFACRWTNGDVSFVLAPSKEAAIEQLDEVDNAEGCPITQVPEFQIHLALTDDGGLNFEGWGELTEDVVWNTLYPKLHEAWCTVWREQEDTNDRTVTPQQQERIRRAVQDERERVGDKKVTEPQTEVGKEIKRMSDMPTSLINKIVREGAKERLKNFKPRGERH
jgi:hypothetical protein